MFCAPGVERHRLPDLRLGLEGALEQPTALLLSTRAVLPRHPAALPARRDAWGADLLDGVQALAERDPSRERAGNAHEQPADPDDDDVEQHGQHRYDEQEQQAAPEDRYKGGLLAAEIRT